jgi:hypothetical protein
MANNTSQLSNAFRKRFWMFGGVLRQKDSEEAKIHV